MAAGLVKKKRAKARGGGRKQGYVVPKKIVAFRMPKELLVALTRAAQKQHISRNKLCELVLWKHLTQADSEALAPPPPPLREARDVANLFA